jgi:type II secretory pathway component PulM
MKGLIVAVFIGGSILISLFFSFRYLSAFREDHLRLKTDYDQIIKMKQSLKEKGVSKETDSLLNQLNRIVQRHELKNKVSHIQSHDEEVEITLQNISQEEMVVFIRSLNQSQSLRILRADLSVDDLNQLSLSLTLQP